MSTDKIALVTGYTGESGKALVKELITNNQFKKIILVGRRKVDYTENEYKEKTEQREIDFDQVDNYTEAFRGADVHFCCLGTTRGKSGAEGFRRVDFDYIVGAARLAKQEGCKHFHLVSSQGANENSYFLYPQVKGQAEAALTKMSFPRLSIYRPAMLMVDRVEHRLMERIAQSIISHTVQRIAPEWITTPVEILGRAMCFNSFTKDRPSVEILDNHAIFRLAEQQPNPSTGKTKATNEL
ncbi:unnamed protein product [Adineta steineri]|uniref:Protein HTATIP2 n=1 Tax=Adineta steineri TaxID=433720 RepID=A0A813SBS8_9BILA|nr:unnamed protein product [Adineta steineri]CAF3794048.1 unnamed protein product [Adineta steineri]